MKDNTMEKYAALFRRDESVHRIGAILTLAPVLLLVLAVILAQLSPEEEGVLEGNKLAALLIIVGVALFEIAFWIYFLCVHGKVRTLLAENMLAILIEQGLPFTFKDRTTLVFRHKGGKNFCLIAEGKGREQLKMNFDDFTSLYDGDIAFYYAFVKAFSRYLQGDLPPVYSLTLKGDFPEKRGSVAQFLLVEKGELTAQAKKQGK